MKRTHLALLPALLLAALGGCNLFDPFDSPTGDTQLLSAARACFDRGDIACAKDLYSQLSSSQSDVANSETAFAILDENGADMAAFMGAFGGGAGGQGITKLANALIAKGTGSTLRNNILGAYQKVNSISDTNLKGLVRFVAGITLLAEVMAEGAGTSFDADDVVATPSACKAASSVTACAGLAACGVGDNGIDDGGSAVNINSDTALGSPSLEMVDNIITNINNALSNEIGAGGSIADGAKGFAAALDLITPATGSGDCYRYTLLQQGVGE